MSQILTLGQLIQERGGSIKTGPFGTTLKANEYSESGVPIISVGEVGYGSLTLRQDTPSAPYEVTERLPEYLLEPGDIVFGRKGGVDRSAWVKPSESGWFLGSDGIRVRLPSSVDSRFVAYQFQSQATRNWLLQHASGSTMLSLSQKILNRIPLRLPSLNDQREIAGILASIDEKIVANTRIALCASETANALFSQVYRFADRAIQLSELVSAQYGVTTSAHAGPGPKLIRVTDINKKPWIEWETTPNCIVSDSALRKYSVSPGDILVARMADPGKAAFVEHGDPEAVFASYLVRLKPKDPVQALYIYHFLQSPQYRNFAEGAMTGSVQRNMNAKVIVSTRINLPESNSILRFNASVAPLHRVIKSHLAENRILASTRDSLLPQLMSGKLRVDGAELSREDTLV